ncbi:MAG: DNA-J related domain-containing protein [Cellvibrionaceae bacterium]
MLLNNETKNSVLNILECYQDGISEFDLMKELDAIDFFQNENDLSVSELKKTNELLLFHKHFMLMHILYRLQDELLAVERYLDISPLKIQIINFLINKESFVSGNIKSDQERSLSLSEDNQLKTYYLDWGNYMSTTEDNVKSMLNNFWRKLLDPKSREDAFLIFDLPCSSSQEEIKIRYRQLAKKHHPDKGGIEEKFIEIQQAFEILTGQI